MKAKDSSLLQRSHLMIPTRCSLMVPAVQLVHAPCLTVGCYVHWAENLMPFIGKRRQQQQDYRLMERHAYLRLKMTPLN